MTLLLLVMVALSVYYIFIYKQDYKTFFSGITGKKCPNCGNPVEKEFNVCPVCKETLKRKCTNCGNSVDVTWKYCPFCEVPLRKSDFNEEQ